MTDEKFVIRAYGKSELAMLYLPHHSKGAALKILKSWLEVNPRLQPLAKSKGKFYLPKQVKMMVEELGEPFNLE